MKPPTLRTASFLAVDLILLAVCIIYVPVLLVSARAPFDAVTVDGHTKIVNIIDKTAGGRIILGDRILRWNDETIRSRAIWSSCGRFSPRRHRDAYTRGRTPGIRRLHQYV